MEEPKGLFVIPFRKKKEEEFSGLTEADRILLSDINGPIASTIGAYIRSVNTEIVSKIDVISEEGMREKTRYANTAKMVYKDLMSAIEIKIKGEGILDHSITINADPATWKGKEPIIAAFQCAERELVAKGWSPVHTEGYSAGGFNKDLRHDWQIKITCSFQ